MGITKALVSSIKPFVQDQTRRMTNYHTERLSLILLSLPRITALVCLECDSSLNFHSFPSVSMTSRHFASLVTGQRSYQGCAEFRMGVPRPFLPFVSCFMIRFLDREGKTQKEKSFFDRLVADQYQRFNEGY